MTYRCAEPDGWTTVCYSWRSDKSMKTMFKGAELDTAIVRPATDTVPETMPELESDTSTSSSTDDDPPEFGQLKHIAYYSCDASGVVRYDRSCLRMFRQPRVPADLSEGRAECVYRHRDNTTLGHRIPLDHLLGACFAMGAAPAVRNAHVVTWRGLISKMMLSRAPLGVYISFIDGVLYLMEVDPPLSIIHENQIESGYHGYAFEALCTADNPEATIQVQMDAWKCIVTRTLGDLNLVYGGEVDCIRGPYVGDSTNFLELKTKREMNFRLDTHKWFIQSHLLDVPHIFVGSRDNANVLRTTELVSTEDLTPWWLTEAQANTHAVLHDLRQACASHISSFEDPKLAEDIIWRATLHRGTVQTFCVAGEEEISQWCTQVPQGERVGLLPAEHVARLRASAAWAKVLNDRA